MEGEGRREREREKEGGVREVERGSENERQRGVSEGGTEGEWRSVSDAECVRFRWLEVRYQVRKRAEIWQHAAWVAF